MDPLAALLERALLAVLLPLWLVAGSADWACHRQQRIEHNAGARESLLHLAMLAELAAGLWAALLLELNAGALALVLAACIAHELTLWVDLAWAESRRSIPWFEQWVHGWQQALPWVGAAALLLLHRGQALAMLGLGSAVADWRLHWRAEPLPPAYLAGFLLAALLLVAGPFVSEFVRCWRAARRPGS